MQRQLLRHQPDEHAQHVSRILTIVLIVCFAGWLAGFGVTAPWDLGGGIDVGEFFGRFFGLLVLLALIFAPLAIVTIGGRRPGR